MRGWMVGYVLRRSNSRSWRSPGMLLRAAERGASLRVTPRSSRRVTPLACAPSCPASAGDASVPALSTPLRPASTAGQHVATSTSLELLPFSPAHQSGLPLWSPPGVAVVLCVLFAAREGLPALSLSGDRAAPPARRPAPSALALEQERAAAERRAKDAQLDAEAADERRRVVQSETARLEVRPAQPPDWSQLTRSFPG